MKTFITFTIPVGYPLTARNPDSTFLETNLWGYGFSYIFRKQVFEKVQFPLQDHGEDYVFYTRLKAMNFKLGTFSDYEGLVLHLMHKNNSSIIFPQYILPSGMLDKIFPEFNK